MFMLKCLSQFLLENQDQAYIQINSNTTSTSNTRRFTKAIIMDDAGHKL